MSLKKIDLQYFAVLREARGLSREVKETGAETARLLYEELRSEYGFRLSVEDLQVAVNGEFADFGRTLEDGDEVVFIPPVAGG
jgi:molybdopterin converting factor subunit 1